MHLILTGATGLVGSGVLHHILSLSPATATAKQISRVSILSRKSQIPLLNHPDRPRDNTYTKIEVIEHKDFGSYPSELMEKLGLGSSGPPSSSSAGVPKGGDEDDRTAVIWALGISQTETKSKEEYTTITKTYAVEAAKAFSSSLLQSSSSSSSTMTKSSNPTKPLTFIYVSGEGATPTPNMFTPLFGRVKGETETSLLSLTQTPPYSSNLSVYNVRPAAVDGLNQPAVWDEALQKDLRKGIMFRATAVALLPPIRRGWFLTDMHSPTEELGRVITELAVGDGGSLEGKKGTEGFEGRVIRNSGLRSLASSS